MVHKKGENVLGAITNRGVSPFIFKDKTSEQSKTKLKEEKKFILQSFVWLEPVDSLIKT